MGGGRDDAPATAREPPKAWDRPGLHQAGLSQKRLVVPVVLFALDAAVLKAGDLHIVEHERLSGRGDVAARRGWRSCVGSGRPRLYDAGRILLSRGANLVFDVREGRHEDLVPGDD